MSLNSSHFKQQAIYIISCDYHICTELEIYRLVAYVGNTLEIDILPQISTPTQNRIFTQNVESVEKLFMLMFRYLVREEWWFGSW